MSFCPNIEVTFIFSDGSMDRIKLYADYDDCKRIYTPCYTKSEYENSLSPSWSLLRGEIFYKGKPPKCEDYNIRSL